jgi:hypothetical protein
MTPPADLNGLVRFAETRNLVSAHVQSHLKLSLKTVWVGYCSGLVNAIRCRPTLCSCSKIINILCFSSNVNSTTAESKRVTWFNYWAGEVCACFACRAAPCHVASAALTQFTAARGSRQTLRNGQSKPIDRQRRRQLRRLGRKGRLDSETLRRRVWLEPYQCATGSTAVVMIVATSTILQHKSLAVNMNAYRNPKLLA